MRIKEAMDDVVQICDKAVESVETSRGKFTTALRAYFQRVHKASNTFSKSGLNKKRIVQFGLACVYLHRTGLAVNGKYLFKKLPQMKQHLPKTHALLKKKIRVNSITRNETMLKALIKKEEKTGSGLDKWVFPDF